MNVKRRTSLVASLVCGAVLIATATVGAATITGTPGNDTIEGKRQGRQALLARAATTSSTELPATTSSPGGAGNDLLVGGAGADTLSCGPGRDTASGDSGGQDRKGL